MNLHELVKDIKSLVPTLGALSTETKNQALESIAQILIRKKNSSARPISWTSKRRKKRRWTNLW
jgi:gamma-glutamyl phosphate reductase